MHKQQLRLLCSCMVWCQVFQTRGPDMKKISPKWRSVSHKYWKADSVEQHKNCFDRWLGTWVLAVVSLAATSSYFSADCLPFQEVTFISKERRCSSLEYSALQILCAKCINILLYGKNITLVKGILSYNSLGTSSIQKPSKQVIDIWGGHYSFCLAFLNSPVIIWEIFHRSILYKVAHIMLFSLFV